MSAYVIIGPSGSGKSTVGRVLKQRGFRVIETDFEDGLSGWFNNDDGKRATDMPQQPYPKAWVDSHSWLWDKVQMNALLDSVGDEPVFFCGGSFNQLDFFDSFKRHFGLYVGESSLVERLQEREPERWQDDSVELQNLIDWNNGFRDYCQKNDVIVIDSSMSPDTVADTILQHI